VRLSDHVEKTGKAFFHAAEKSGLEGIMAKDLGSPYRSGVRTRDWLKIKAQRRQEAVICGFTEPRASRKHFGALILGVYRDGQLSYAGHVGTGFDERNLGFIYEKLKPLITEQSPFEPEPKTNMPVRWVEPRLVCEVRFSEWTAEGRMRHPVFMGLREDKSPREVKREEESPAGAILRKVDIKTKADLTHLDKVFWPKEGYTKKDLIEYYGRMANWILPYLKDRPQSLNRHPNGMGRRDFSRKTSNRRIRRG